MKTDKELCFDRIRPELRMPDDHLHFPAGDLSVYSRSYDSIRCVVMQGGQGDVKHWAFNDPPRREGAYRDAPPSPAEYRKLATRVTDLHPMTIMQNARTSAGGQLSLDPDASGHGRAGRDLEGREGFDLASRLARQRLRRAADVADDLEADPRLRRADVADGRSSVRAIQSLPPGDQGHRHRDALETRKQTETEKHA